MGPGSKRSVRVRRLLCTRPSGTRANRGSRPCSSSSRCSFTAPLVRRYCAQSKTLAQSSIRVASRRLRPPQVTEQHGHKLSPTTEPASVALGPVLGDRLLELLAGKQLQHLAENAGYSYHGGGGPPYDSRLATQTVAEFYPRRSKPNLDKSGPNWLMRCVTGRMP